MLLFKNYIQRRLLIIPIVFIFLFTVKNSMSQEYDSVGYKNIIKYNFTAPMLWGDNNYIFEYERILSANRSLSIGFGYRSFPKLVGIGKSDSAIIIRKHENKGGITATIDYRFYLKNENKYGAPRGIYLSPYVNFLNNKFENTISTFYNDIGLAKITTQIDIFNIGGQLGYQFVFFNRLSLDLSLIGPSVSWYNINMKIDGSLERDNVDEEMAEIILENYPILKIFFDEYEFNKKGRVTKFGYGFRYYFTVGFLF